MYPLTEPFDHGLLDVGDGNHVYWEVCGNPMGKPAVVLHGGPGSGCTPGWRQFFDPSVYRVVLFDQRGCGRSTPHAAEYGVELDTNTTHHLIRDCSLVEAYSRLLEDPDPDIRQKAAKHWCLWEDSHVAIHPSHQPDPRYNGSRFRMVFARLVTHYWRHAAWLDDGILLREAGKLAGIPGVLVHGRLDVSGPPDIAWHLAQAWPDAELHLIEDAGHGSGHPNMSETVVAALDRFAALSVDR